MSYNIWNDCPRLPLPDVLSFVVDNRGKTVPTSDSGHVLIATNCVRNESLYPRYEKVRFLTDETYQTWFRAHPIPGDILFVCKGTPGRVCLVPDPIDFCIAQDMVALRANPNVINNLFLLAVLRSHSIQEQITNTSVGDVIPHFKKSYFDQILIPIPPMDIQQKIGKMYFDLSEKIVLNEKINDHLYEVLQTVYQQRFPSFDQGTMLGALSDICNYSTDRIAVSCLTVSNYYSTENMLPGKAGAVVASNLPSAVQTTKCKVGDVLISNIRPYFKKIIYCQSNCGCSTDVLCFSPNTSKLSAYLFSTLYADHFFDFMVAGAKGTKMPRGDKQQIMTYPVYIPSETELDGFNEIAQPILSQIERNRLENRSLSNLRDGLLPKLMSGDLDVSSIPL